MKKLTIFICALVVLLTASGFWLKSFKKTRPPIHEATGLDNDLLKFTEMALSSKSGQLQVPDTALNVKLNTKLAPTVLAGGKRWDLNFADKSLSDETRKRIGYDVNLVFSHLPSFEIDVLPSIIEIDGIQLDRRVRFEGGKNKRPIALVNSGFSHLERGIDESSLFVPKAVISAYIKAIEFEKINQTAYQQLDQFLEKMNKLKERPIENVVELFIVADDFKSAQTDLAAIPAAAFAEGWGGKSYREPSILDIASTSGTSLEKYGSLIATTYSLAAGKLEDLPPLVFNNGQWRFLLQRPPT